MRRAIPLVLVLFCATVSAQAPVGQTSQDLTVDKTVRLWTQNNNVIPVCWESPGFDREKAIVMSAVSTSWELYANVWFTGWIPCPPNTHVSYVRVRVTAQGNNNLGANGNARVGMDALSRAVDNNPGVNLSFDAAGTADQGRVEYIAVHEFGHVLGFIHEQDAPGNVEGPAHCNDTVVKNPNANPVTPYDRDSIMNYCNRDGNRTGNLTDADIQGVQAIYGVRRPNVVAANSCTSALTTPPVSLAAVWNDRGGASFAVFPSTLRQFGYHSQWMIRDGGWGDSIKWSAGDFNGDGRSDIGAVWNWGGTNVLSVRLSTGAGFVPIHWNINGGGWMDSTQWLPGDFNGDGFTDLAAVWNHGGLVSIAVFPSDGTRFLYHSQWAIQDGGWHESIKWMAGDFNGDGRTDLAAAWNNGGRTTLTVRLANANNTFSHVHWSLDAGRWMNATVWLAGDFNGDGRADLAQIWNDLARASIAVSLSSGSGFAAPASWSVRDGGLPVQVRWTTGDFNGDRRTDIAAAWNSWGTNVLTVRQSTGNAFVPVHWSTNAGGWMDSTAWCAGHFQ